MILLLNTLTLLLLGQAALSQTATLTVMLRTPSGTAAPPGQLRVRSIVGETIYNGALADRATMTAPFGQYTITFRSDFTTPIDRNVKIDRPEMLVVLAADLAETVMDVTNPLVALTAAVEPTTNCGSNEVRWAKLVGVFSDYTAETFIDRQGFALFDNIQPGTYVLVVIDGRHPRAAVPIQTSGRVTKVTVRLSSCN